ncbi:hypothetical protein [Neoroseomonas oryzicola]|uniref:Uncharacterized protein n=1 Tax=Neoroseomonas oryzicola TaxID=535904 RepID=A0A9X9WLI5_9PROT|nr:hypothetical protein [Neoroseomonas oryzicola]MBR0661195.1 hypothetical protein [Neoroseomonas oryzicola]NKE17560.1 hypothetical protein [Neoroseomonas oryzicola]
MIAATRMLDGAAALPPDLAGAPILDRLLLPAWHAALATMRRAAQGSPEARSAAVIAAEITGALADMSFADGARSAPGTLAAIAEAAETDPLFADGRPGMLDDLRGTLDAIARAGT